MGMTSAKIHNDVIKWMQLNNYRVYMKNVYYFSDTWECDVFGVTAGGLPVEVEVKISKNDFLADFDKDVKHYETKYGRGAAYFYFAVPHDLVDYVYTRLPEYAGLLSYHKSSRNFLHVAKQADCLHNNRIDHKDDWKKIALKLMDRVK